MKRKKIRELSMEVMVGTFMFAVLLALCIFTIVLSRENFFQKTCPGKLKSVHMVIGAAISDCQLAANPVVLGAFPELLYPLQRSI